MSGYSSLLGPKAAAPQIRHSGTTSQTQPLAGRETEMHKNAAGGYVFTLDDWKTLRRFLVLGTTQGTYYAGADQLTGEALAVLDRALASDPIRFVDLVVDVSVSGAPLKQSPCIFALARACSVKTGDVKRDCDNKDPVTKGRAYALQEAPKVLRTFSHVYEFLDYISRQRGKGGSGIMGVVKRIILGLEAHQLEYQALKYREREGYSARDMLRINHPKTGTPEVDNLMAWIVKPESDKGRLAVASSERLAAFEALRESDISTIEAAQLIAENKMTHEFVPNTLLGEKVIWEALLPNLPPTALVRNLRKMTQVGLLKDGNSNALRLVRDKLTNVEVLRRARLHPLRIMGAIAAYGGGTSRYGHGGDFIPSAEVLAVLEDALELSWNAVQPLNRRVAIAVDISGSMSSPSPMAGLNCLEAGLALVAWYKRTEKECLTLLFNTSASLLNVSNKVTFSELKARVHYNGGTDVSSPLRWLGQNLGQFDPEVVITMTDGETWAGTTHVAEELTKLRKKVKHPIANVVVASCATRSSFADPKDPHSLEVVGFDPTVPEAIFGHVAAVFER